MGDEHCNSRETTGEADERMILQLMRNQRTLSPGLEQYSRELAVAAIQWPRSRTNNVSFATRGCGSGSRGNGYVKTWRHQGPNTEYCAISSFALSPNHVAVKTKDIGMAYAAQNLA
jgi:hypothetical protein